MQAALASATDSELLERANRVVALKAWTASRFRYLNLLQLEIRKRNWDNSLFLGQHTEIDLPVFRLHQKVALVNQMLVPLL